MLARAHDIKSTHMPNTKLMKCWRNLCAHARHTHIYTNAHAYTQTYTHSGARERPHPNVHDHVKLPAGSGGRTKVYYLNNHLQNLRSMCGLRFAFTSIELWPLPTALTADLLTPPFTPGELTLKLRPKLFSAAGRPFIDAVAVA